MWPFSTSSAAARRIASSLPATDSPRRTVASVKAITCARCIGACTWMSRAARRRPPRPSVPAMSGATRPDVLGAARYVDSLVAYRQQRDRIPGVQVAMLHDGDVVLSAAYGMADLESPQPMTTAHRFRIASHSKTFTATAVVRLAERGVLHLDDSGRHMDRRTGRHADRPGHAARVAGSWRWRRPRRLGR